MPGITNLATSLRLVWCSQQKNWPIVVSGKPRLTLLCNLEEFIPCIYPWWVALLVSITKLSLLGDFVPKVTVRKCKYVTDWHFPTHSPTKSIFPCWTAGKYPCCFLLTSIPMSTLTTSSQITGSGSSWALTPKPLGEPVPRTARLGGQDERLAPQ